LKIITVQFSKPSTLLFRVLQYGYNIIDVTIDDHGSSHDDIASVADACDRDRAAGVPVDVHRERCASTVDKARRSVAGHRVGRVRGP